MLHLRAISPPADTGRVVDLLTTEAAATNLVVLPGAARQPAGDVVLVLKRLWRRV